MKRTSLLLRLEREIILVELLGGLLLLLVVDGVGTRCACALALLCSVSILSFVFAVRGGADGS